MLSAYATLEMAPASNFGCLATSAPARSGVLNLLYPLFFPCSWPLELANLSSSSTFPLSKLSIIQTFRQSLAISLVALSRLMPIILLSLSQLTNWHDRLFKLRVYETNYSNVEKQLLMKMNISETVRLGLRNAFKHDDPELTDVLQQLYAQCPVTLGGILSRSDKQELDDADADADQHEAVIEAAANDNHINPRVINRILPREMTAVTHAVNRGNRLPTKGNTDMEFSFKVLIREAYEKEYGKNPGWPSIFEDKPLQYARKFGFVNK